MTEFETLFLTLYFGVLGILALHGLHIPWLIYHRLRSDPVPEHPPARLDDPDLPPVTVQIPIYNERVVVDRIIESVARLTYPKEKLEIQILDDSTDETTDIARRLVLRSKEEGVSIDLIHRVHREGFKAGALHAGLQQATGSLIAIFDSDFVPQSDFLLRVVPSFADGNVGMVQARWSHLNENANLLTRLQSLFLDGHFIMESETRDRAGLFLSFNGTAGMWRKSCIDQAGGWCADTLTEDLDLSYRAQLLGWKFRFLSGCIAPAELPCDVDAFKAQQYRWTRGGVQTLRKLALPYLRSSLPFRIKAEFYFHLTSHLMFPLLVVLAVLAYPALSIRLEQSGWKMLLLDLPLYLVGVFSVNSFYLWGQAVIHPFDWKRFLCIPGLVSLGTGLAISNSRAVWDGYFGGTGEFVRTPKIGRLKVGPYQAPKSSTALLEILFSGYLVFCAWHAVDTGCWVSLPFVLLFAIGFGYMGFQSLAVKVRSLRERLRPAAPLSEGRGESTPAVHAGVSLNE